MRAHAKTLVFALVASAALASAIPAQAQNYPQNYPQHGYSRDSYNDRSDRHDQRDWNNRNDYNRGNANAIRNQIEQLRYRVARSDGRDRISEREAAGLRRAVYDLQQQFRDYNRDGLSQRETQRLQDRINQVRSRLQFERHDTNGHRN